MRGLWHKTLVYFGLADEEDEFQDYGEYDEQDEFGDLDEDQSVRRLGRAPEGAQRERPNLHPVPSAPQAKVYIVEPRSFNDAQQVADRFKANTPVIVNLQMADPELSKRLIDFASGLTYGLNGGLQRVADRVFLLTPSNVEVSAEEKRRLQEKGFFG